jgi:hypothetical protein
MAKKYHPDKLIDMDEAYRKGAQRNSLKFKKPTRRSKNAGWYSRSLHNQITKEYCALKYKQASIERWSRYGSFNNPNSIQHTNIDSRSNG